MQDLEAAIKAAVTEINGTKTMLAEARDPKEKEQLRAYLLQLGARELALRDDLKPMRARQLLLLEDAKKYPIGTLPFPGERDAGFNEKVWLGMCEDVQQRVLDRMAAKRELAAVKILSDMRGDMSVEKAEALGIDVLHEVGGKVQLGAFKLPALRSILQNPPKGARIVLSQH